MEQWRECLPAHRYQDMERCTARMQLIARQIEAIDVHRAQLLAEDRRASLEKVRRLMQLKALGEQSAWLFVMECFGFRRFANRRELAASSGLVGSPYSSGESHKEQGISKAGNARMRRMLIEITWCWLRYQPDSALSRWYRARFTGGGKRLQRVGIVALARKLLIALWRYLEHGEIPAGAQLKAV
jgi:transposase